MSELEVELEIKALDTEGYLVSLNDVKSEMSRVVRSAVEQAFMAGQSDCGVDPSFSSAKKYADSILGENKEPEKPCENCGNPLWSGMCDECIPY